MKLVIFLVLCTLVVGSASWQSQAANGSHKQAALIRFDRPVILNGMTLQGEYLIVHDDAAMKRGEACSYIYKGDAEIRNKLVVSFHCVPVERAKADHFMVRTEETSAGTIEFREFQYKGDTEGHAVPTSVNAHVNNTN